MVGTARSLVSFMNKFGKLGLIKYNSGIKINSSDQQWRPPSHGSRAPS